MKYLLYKLLIIYFITVVPTYLSQTIIKNTVTKLGFDYNTDYQLDFEKLKNNPKESVNLLVKELIPINKKKISPDEFKKYKKEMHVIWCLRALRYLTGGKTFVAKTMYKFKKSEEIREQFLTKFCKDSVSFFGVWMSRDIIYIAPIDAQMIIINKWKEWEKSIPGTYNFEPSNNIDKWYF